MKCPLHADPEAGRGKRQNIKRTPTHTTPTLFGGLMADNKTKATRASVDRFIKAVKDEQTRRDCKRLIEIMRAVSREDPQMWGPSIVGFGQYHYKYASGREGDFLRIGFSPRKTNISVYMVTGLSLAGEALKKLGKFKTGKGCLYIKRLTDVDETQLTKMLETSFHSQDPTH